jgi:hypothetical protein
MLIQKNNPQVNSHEIQVLKRDKEEAREWSITVDTNQTLQLF